MAADNIRRHKIQTVLGAIALSIVLLFACIVLFSESLIKSLTESKGGKRLGRELVIEGPFKIHWHWVYTEVHAEKIRLGNAPGYPEPNMVTIEALDFTFKPLELLLFNLEFGDIVLNKPHIILEKKSATDTNWNFPTLSKAEAVSQAALADNRHNFPIIQKLELKAGRLIYRDAVKGMDLDIKLDSVSGQGGDEDAKKNSARQFKMSGTGSMQKQQFTLEASGGSLETLRDSAKDFPLKLKLVMGPTEVLVNGTFKDPIKLTGVNASLKITGHNMADLFYFTAIPLPPTPPYALNGELTKNGGVWGYNNFNGKVGGSDLSGNLSYDTSKERGFLKADLISDVMDSRDLGGLIGLSPSGENAAPEQKQAAAVKKASPKLIPDVPLKLERLRATDLDVTLKVAKIAAPSLPFKGMDAHFYLNNGLLKLNSLNVVLADGTIDGSIEIDAAQDIPPMQMNLNFRKLSLRQFFTNTRFEKTTEGFFGGKVTLTGTGTSLADVLAASNGAVTIIMSGGKISLLLIEASDLDIAEALPLFLGKDRPTNIRCGVADFDVKDGMIGSKVVVLDTDDSLLVGNVKINLKREVISAKLDAKPKDWSIFAGQIPLTVTGKLKAPSVGVDVKKTASKATTAAVFGSLLTPLAAIIPFIEIGDAKNADCRALIDNANKSVPAKR